MRCRMQPLPRSSVHWFVLASCETRVAACSLGRQTGTQGKAGDDDRRQRSRRYRGKGQGKRCAPRHQVDMGADILILIVLSRSSVGHEQLGDLENELLQQKVQILQEELARRETSNKLLGVDAGLDMVRRLRVPPRLRY